MNLFVVSFNLGGKRVSIVTFCAFMLDVGMFDSIVLLHVTDD